MVGDAALEESLPDHLHPEATVETEGRVPAVGPQDLRPLGPEPGDRRLEEQATGAPSPNGRLHSHTPQPDGAPLWSVEGPLGTQACHAHETGAGALTHPEVEGPGAVVLGEDHVGVEASFPQHRAPQRVGGGSLDLLDPQHGAMQRALRARGPAQPVPWNRAAPKEKIPPSAPTSQ